MNKLFSLFEKFADSSSIMDISFLVGGTVRDLLSGQTIRDYDIVIKHDAADLAMIFASEVSASFVILDEKFGIIRVAKNGEFIDICAMKGESIEDDLSQRDFTINAMALNLKAYKTLTGSEEAILARHVIDPFNGLKDLRFKIIRMVSEDNLVQDPLRLLRAYRFASMLDFSIHIYTSKAIRKHAHKISGVSVERISEELRHILKVNFSSKTIYDMQNSGLLLGIFPELRDVSYEKLYKAIQTCSCVENILNRIYLYFPSYEEHFAGYFQDIYRVICLKLAVLLHDLSTVAAARLKMSGKEAGFLSMISEQHGRLVMIMDADKAEKIDFLIQTGHDIYPLLVFTIANEITSQPDAGAVLRFCTEILKIYHSDILPKKRHLPILTGDDLIEKFHLKPSPLFSRLLRQAERLFFHGIINSKDEALNAVAEMLGSEQDKQIFKGAT